MTVYTSEQEILFQEFKKGNDNAFSFFYRFFINDLYAYGIGLGAESETVKDVIQDVFLKIYDDRKDFYSIEHLKYSLLKSVKNRLYDIYKSKAYSTSVNTYDEVMNFSLNTTVLDDIIEEEERIITEQRIDKLLSVLTGKQKEIIYLRFMQELEYPEIAKILNISVNAARKLLSRSLSRLRGEQ
jgi:RNA polymerase sigma factor (sigma-70 family)